MVLPASGVALKLRYLAGLSSVSVTLWNAAQALLADPFSMLAVWSADPMVRPAATCVAPMAQLAFQVPVGL